MFHPLSWAERIYRREVLRRRRRFSASPTRIGCPVISVGNLTTGGTGKTPTVQWIARHLQAKNLRVGIVACGYRGQSSQSGAVVCDGERIFLNAEDAGDEPLLHARALPNAIVVIGRDRVWAAREAARLGAQVIVLDDGFQFWSLHRDFDLVLLDARRPFHNGHLLPRGHLREPKQALERAHGVLLTRADAATPQQIEAARVEIAKLTSAPLWQATHAPVALRDETTGARHDLSTLRGQNVAAISALADNGAFVASLLNCGAQIVAKLERRDHHRWRESEVRRVVQMAQANDAQVIVTTEKDAVKIEPVWAQPLPLMSLQIELRVQNEEEMRDFIFSALKEMEPQMHTDKHR